MDTYIKQRQRGSDSRLTGEHLHCSILLSLDVLRVKVYSVLCTHYGLFITGIKYLQPRRDRVESNHCRLHSIHILVSVVECIML